MKQAHWLEALERVILALWIGGACGVGYVAVPTLFANLADRQMAGGLAGSMFKVVAIVGIVAFVLLLAVRVLRGVWANWRTWVLIAAGVGVAVGIFILQPQMAELKVAQALVPGSDAARRFSMLHGISSGVYMLTTVLGLVLLAAGSGARRA